MLSEIEAGKVVVVLTKDLSRLGRNSSLTGLYINFTFPKYSVRYIAINDHFDTIDPNSTDNDVAGIKNWFNEFFAKDTSRKIRAVQKAKGERGVPLTTNVPFGYRKDPEDRTKWIVDEAAALVPPTTLRSGKTISYVPTTAATREAARHTLSGRLCWRNWSGCT